jgi:hypothetical protein
MACVSATGIGGHSALGSALLGEVGIRCWPPVTPKRIARSLTRRELLRKLPDDFPTRGLRSERQRPRKRRLDHADERVRRQPSAFSGIVCGIVQPIVHATTDRALRRAIWRASRIVDRAIRRGLLQMRAWGTGFDSHLRHRRRKARFWVLKGRIFAGPNCVAIGQTFPARASRDPAPASGWWVDEPRFSAMRSGPCLTPWRSRAVAHRRRTDRRRSCRTL